MSQFDLHTHTTVNNNVLILSMYIYYKKNKVILLHYFLLKVIVFILFVCICFVLTYNNIVFVSGKQLQVICRGRFRWCGLGRRIRICAERPSEFLSCPLSSLWRKYTAVACQSPSPRTSSLLWSVKQLNRFKVVSIQRLN